MVGALQRRPTAAIDRLADADLPASRQQAAAVRTWMHGWADELQPHPARFPRQNRDRARRSRTRSRTRIVPQASTQAPPSWRCELVLPAPLRREWQPLIDAVCGYPAA